MKRLIKILIASFVLLTSCDAPTGIEISEAWTRPAQQDENGAIYFLLQNHSGDADELLGITSDVAETVEIHESSMEGDVMQMRQVASIPIDANENVEFEPGGYHVMLVKLKRDLKPGEEIQVTLQFKNHEAITLSVSVQE
jgi:periplasmic copper chaperone A